ncbi:tRNA dihydrouridine(20/20a) synthase DusA [Aestuariispira insulae]|uniref:tRNA-dihydrouridine(20/20a) synthase n=1 Tax=Aestuariispira insulae TaxID=1461337 RepID=A0A3D9HGI8_9PROT|nr:tRNA dihydrouridine(20/20a) synthase DusA [Aestuariispira insulae]RED48574.1 tRNA-U16,U17-dihydrouridine synthase [Aestuariispira insulae]
MTERLTDFNRRLSIAPMMDWTDRYDRYFLRLFSKHMLLYTEMVTTGAVIHGERQRLIGFDPFEHPVACQLGGSNPADLAEAARIVADFGYDEINLNVGCPSDRVQNGNFGACLMADPALVARCVEAMNKAVDIPVTVKHRIGIDGRETYEEMEEFVRTVMDAGCHHFIVHARIAILAGLSPKENRDVPPLKYHYVHRLKNTLPDLNISINGGIKSLGEAEEQLERLDGVMIGRAAYQDPYCLVAADHRIFGEPETTPKTRHDIIREFLPYVERMLSQDIHLNHISRHIMGLFNGCPGARQFRRYLSENAYQSGADAGVIERAAAQVNESRLGEWEACTPA